MQNIVTGNDFTLIVDARRQETASQRFDLRVLERLEIYLVMAGRAKVLQSYTLDELGRAVIEVGGDALPVGVWGVELVGTYQMANVRSTNAKAFKIVDGLNQLGLSGDGIEIVVEVNVLSNAEATRPYVDAAIADHDADVTSHSDIRTALAQKVSDIKVDGISIVDGNKVANLDSDDFGKVDDVKVNGVSVVSNKEAAITMPTKVSDLANDSQFTTKSYVDGEVAQAGHVDDVQVNGTSVVSGKVASVTMPTKVSDLTNDADYRNATQVQSAINTAIEANLINDGVGTVDGTTGTPSVDIVKQGTTLHFDFHNIKGAQGDRGEKGETGETGPQGATSVYDQTTHDFLTTLETTTGQSQTKTMTQKAVTDEVFATQENLLENIALGLTRRQCCITADGKWSWKTSGTGNKKQYHSAIPVTPGEVLIVKATSTSLQTGWCAWLTSSYTGTATNNTALPYVSGTSNLYLPIGVYQYLTVPEGAAWFVMNNSNTSAADTTWIVKKKDYAESATSKLVLTPIASTFSTNGHVDYQNGLLVTAGAVQTNVVKKYTIDTVKVYYADVRAFNNGTDFASGVAYFDEDDNFICSQCFDYSAAYDRKKVPLKVPQNAAYCYILGTDGTYHTTDTVAQLYAADYVENESTPDYHETLVAQFAMMGTGADMVNKDFTTGIKINTLYKIKVSYDTWTMPDPTANTTAFGVCDKIGNSNMLQKVITQSNFGNGISEMTFITNENSEGIRIYFRAVQGELVKFELYEVRRDKEIVNDAVSYGQPETGRMLYNISKVKGVVLKNNENGSTGVEQTEIDSAWAVAFPSSYTPNGKPTQVIAMLHGASGFVSQSVMGYAVQKWLDWRNLYLSHGFAVLEINGWGISTESDNKSRHWACPPALETIDKAFDTLREQYNVADKLMLHGTSMGGATSWAYALTRPNKVAAVGLFSPATLSWIMLKDRSLENDYELAAANWQYADAAAAVADDFQRIIGYDPIIRAMRFKDGAYSPPEQLAGLDVLQYGQTGNQYVLVGQPLQYPVRIWHGDADPTVPVVLSQIIADAYRRGGQNVSIRVCPGETHAICTGGTQYVCNEAVDFFEMYR